MLRQSFSEANLPKLPGLNTYKPKRTTWGRQKYFDVGADGVMLEARRRPQSSPGRAHRIMASTNSLNSTRATSSRLRPMSAMDLRSGDSINSMINTSNLASSDLFTGDADQLASTLQRKEQVMAGLRQLSPLTVNQKRVALQSQLTQIEAEEQQMIKENLPPSESRRLLNSSQSTSTIALNKPPKWVKHDREVLRFYMFFKESVPESSFETERVRKCTLFYFLADDTCKLTEPKVANSGIAGGDMLKRAVFMKVDGKTPYSPIDFMIGSHIILAGKNFRVVDADSNTRKYFKKTFNIDMPVAEKIPDDVFVKDQKERSALSATLSRRITNEALLGGRPGLWGYKMVKHVADIPHNQIKELRFKAIWDDSTSMYGSRKTYSIVYHLIDDEVEIRNKKASKGGDPFPLLVKKGRLPRDFEAANEISDNPIGRNEEKYYIDTDFICGNFIHCFGRDLLIVSCSRETELYYKRVHNITQVPVFVKPIEQPLIKHEVPPYNGWGSEEDSLASCLSLVPTAVQRDMLRFMENQGKTLRFQGKFENPSTPADSERRFVFTYYLEDETVAIFEPPIRNSGVIGGKFLSRGRYKLAVRAKKDDELDATRGRDKHPLVILLKEKMAQYMSGGSYMLLNAFKHFGGIGGNNSISLTEFQHGCRMCGMPLTRKNAKTLFNLYDIDGSGSISFQEFVDGIMSDEKGGKFGSDAAKSTARWIRPADFFVGARVKILFPETGSETMPFTITGSDEYTRIYKELHPHEFPRSNVEFIVRELATKLQQYNVNVRHVFKSYDPRGTGRISHTQFKTLIGKWAKDFGFVDDELSEEDANTLVRHYDDDDDGSISISEFCDALTAAPMAFRDQIDDNAVESAERNIYDELHDKPKGFLREEFNKLDERGDGHITIDEFQHFLTRHGINLSEVDSAALFSHYDAKGRGFFEYEQFAKLMEADHFISTKRSRTGSNKNKSRDPKDMKDYSDILKRRASLVTFDDRVVKQMKSFCKFFYPRRTVLRKAFLSHDTDGNGVLSKYFFLFQYQKISFLFLLINMFFSSFFKFIAKKDWITSIKKANPEADEALITAFKYQLFPMEMSACPYQEFMDAIFRQDVASYKNLLNRGCRYDRKETWGNVSSTIGGDWD
jgi:EF-hand domain-containing protein 1